MTMEHSDIIKATAIQTSNLPSNVDPQLEAMMQSLLLQDSDLMKILKGEITEPLNLLTKMITWLQQEAQTLHAVFRQQNNEEIMPELLAFTEQLQQINKQIDLIESHLKEYQRYLPYLLLFTSTSVLSNISIKEANSVIRKIDLMIMRDKLDMSEYDDDSSYAFINFLDALKIRLIFHVKRNIEGFTFRGLIEERKTTNTIITEQTGQKDKKRGRLI